MTSGRTQPTHDGLEIEALVSTTSTGEQTPKLTVEQRAIAALCREVLPSPRSPPSSIFPLASSGSWSVTGPMSTW